MIFFRLFFFQSDRLTRYQETHSTVNEKKRGWPKGNLVLELDRFGVRPFLVALPYFANSFSSQPGVFQ